MTIGAMTNPNKLQKTFKSVNNSKITATTITKYIEYLEDAFLIEEANRYDIKGKSYIGTPLKYYFMDMGLRNSRIHYRQMEVTHSMENVIYNELRMRGFLWIFVSAPKTQGSITSMRGITTRNCAGLSLRITAHILIPGARRG